MGKRSAIAPLIIAGALIALPAAAQQVQQPTKAQLDYVASLIPIGMRSIPSESMLPNLTVGDRAVIVANTPEPVRGQVVIFRHPNSSDRVMINRIIGLPGDRIQMKGGQLFLNGEAVTRTLVREVSYISDGSNRPFSAMEYSEQLPGEETPHLIHEFSNRDRLDETPEFLVPEGHLFMMGDNRDNSEDSRAPSGHRALATVQPQAWPNGGAYLSADKRDDAIGFVPVRNLMGRAATIVFSFNMCSLTDAQRAAGAECLRSKIAEPL